MAIISAAAYDSYECMVKLIEAGADVNYFNPEEEREHTAIHLSAEYCEYKLCLKLLLDTGADPYIKNGEGKNAFEVATESNRAFMEDYF